MEISSIASMLDKIFTGGKITNAVNLSRILAKSSPAERTNISRAISAGKIQMPQNPPETQIRSLTPEDVSSAFLRNTVQPVLSEAVKSPLSFGIKQLLNKYRTPNTPEQDLQNEYIQAAENVFIPQVNPDAIGKMAVDVSNFRENIEAPTLEKIIKQIQKVPVVAKPLEGIKNNFNQMTEGIGDLIFGQDRPTRAGGLLKIGLSGVMASQTVPIAVLTALENTPNDTVIGKAAYPLKFLSGALQGMKENLIPAFNEINKRYAPEWFKPWGEKVAIPLASLGMDIAVYKTGMEALGKGKKTFNDYLKTEEAPVFLSKLKQAFKQSVGAGNLGLSIKDISKEGNIDFKNPVITNAAINVGGKIYEAPSHGEAIQLAKEAGEDVSNVDREAKGLFRTSDGKLITRDEAEKTFGIRSSEDIPTQFGEPSNKHVPTPTTKKDVETPFIVNKRERGFVTSIKEELPSLKVSGQYIPRSTDQLAVKARNLIESDILTAEKMARGTDEKSVATAAELLKYYNEQAESATSSTVKDVFYQKAADLANEKARQLTDLGRSIQAASILGRLTPEGQVKFAAREIQKYNEAVGLKEKIPELTGQQTQYIINEMREIQGMAEGTERAMRFQKLQNYINDLVPTPLFKKLTTIWKAGLLTGIKTSGTNIFANLSHLGSELIKDIPASMVDKVTSLFTGKRTVTPTLKGLLEGGKEGAKRGLNYIKTGFDERNIGTKLDFSRVNFGKGKLARALQAYTDTVFRVMGAEDQPFYYASKLRSLYSQAKAEAINKGLKGEEAQKFIDDLIKNPTDEMIKNATFDAETATFQNRTKLGDIAKGIQNLGGGAGQIVVPFGRTPSAVAMQILNYSPVGIIKSISENIGKGNFDQRLFSQSMGRALTGTAVLYLGSLLAKNDLLTGARPTGEKEQKLWELEGKQPNSIKIGGKWRQVQVLGPIGNLLLIGGIFQKEFDKSGSPTEAIANSLASSAQSFSQQTFLTGVSNFVDAISDPARSAEYVAGSTLSSIVPTIVADTARALDTKERRASTILEKFQARIPGLREMLEPQVNVLGEEKETTSNPLEIMIDPTRPIKSESTPVIAELRRLFDAGFNVSPALLGDKNGYDSLTPKENTELWKRAGEIVNDKLNTLFKTTGYIKLNDETKAKAVNSIVDKSGLVAKVGAVLNTIQNIEDKKELVKKLAELKKSKLLTKDIYKLLQQVR